MTRDQGVSKGGVRRFSRMRDIPSLLCHAGISASWACSCANLALVSFVLSIWRLDPPVRCAMEPVEVRQRAATTAQAFVPPKPARLEAKEKEEANLRTNAHGLVFKSRALYLFDPSHPVRTLAISIMVDKWFKRAMLLIFTVSVALVATHDPLKGEREGFNKVVYYFDFFFFVAFGVEALVKIIAYGFAFHSGAYLRST